MAPSMCSLLGLAVLLTSSLVSADKTIKIPATVPKTAGPVVDRSFLSYSFDVATFYNNSFDAAGKPNKFVANLIQGIADRTGGTPIIRVGGTAGDRGSYSATQVKLAVNQDATKQGPSFQAPFLVVGPRYFDAFKNFKNAKFILQVPSANDNLSNGIAWARKALTTIGYNRLDAVQIGNDPDSWKGFTVQKYVDRHRKFEKALVKDFPKLNQKIFQGIDKAWNTKTFLPSKEAFAKGLNGDKRIKQVGYHYYQSTLPTLTQSQLQSQIANHTRTVVQMARYRPNINYIHQSQPGVKILMSEVGAFQSTSVQNFNNLATALWHVDYFLHCMAIGVDRIHMQQIVAPGFNLWTPTASKWGSQARVQPNYYSQPFVADFISRTPPRVVEIPMPGQHVLSAYAGYQNGKLAKIAFVNMNLWDGKGKRPGGFFVMNGLPKGVKSAKIHYLTSKNGYMARDSLTYKGMKWTGGSGGSSFKVVNDSKTVKVVGGKLKVPVWRTQAALVELVY
ncbi:unnamed protein product [Zymoseptoria tritici ST99CH_1E4]|uniref:Beta-glucuronidase C-terminal domain-containing protein n=1 Tax=Zymoseptoria tritici ST99CH_1E4 TaxID=1276532 RepID=A0A2H1GQ80_ZYMTR|nr:unnamed protein product [Zymoseptoria tritici ST99CH_1E4]